MHVCAGESSRFHELCEKNSGLIWNNFQLLLEVVFQNLNFRMISGEYIGTHRESHLTQSYFCTMCMCMNVQAQTCVGCFFLIQTSFSIPFLVATVNNLGVVTHLQLAVDVRYTVI